MHKAIITLTALASLSMAMRESDAQMARRPGPPANAILAANYGETYDDVPVEACPKGRTHCETSSASPLVDDCNEAFKKLDLECYHGNNQGSGCRSLVTYGTCTIVTCEKDSIGTPRNFDKGEIEQGLFYLFWHCKDGGGRVGGYHTYDSFPEEDCTKSHKTGNNTDSCAYLSDRGYGNVEVVHS